DDDEFRLTRNPGHVSDLSQATTGVYTAAGGGHRGNLQSGGVGWWHSGGRLFGPLRTAAGDGDSVGVSHTDDPVLGLRAEHAAAGPRRLSHAIHGARGV